jgi:hypothetical protein
MSLSLSQQKGTRATTFTVMLSAFVSIRGLPLLEAVPETEQFRDVGVLHRQREERHEKTGNEEF